MLTDHLRIINPPPHSMKIDGISVNGAGKKDFISTQSLATIIGKSSKRFG